MKTEMKTIKNIVILAFLMGFQLNTIFAGENFSGSTVLSLEGTINVNPAELAPATPLVAAFEEFTEFNENDETAVNEISNYSLAPLTPREADFEDELLTKGEFPAVILAPVTPPDAEFEDCD
jgi:hypothetical protein